MRKDTREYTIAVIGGEILSIPIYEKDELPELVQSGKLKTSRLDEREGAL